MKHLYFVMTLFFFVACGESPLFNHKMEKSFSSAVSGLEAEPYKFKKTDFSFSIDWEKAPSMGENKFILRSWNKNLGTMSGPYQDLPNELFVFLWMPDMGHGSVPVKMKKLATGEYEISNVYFIMKGTWELNVQLKNGSLVVDEVVLNYSI